MYSQETADRICKGLAEGESLRAVCRDAGVAHSSVFEWLARQPEFADQYAQAREVGYRLMAEEIIEISDDAGADVITDKDGNQRTDAERVARSKLRVDSRKWMLSKMLPKLYGDKLDVEHKGSVNITATPTDERL